MNRVLHTTHHLPNFIRKNVGKVLRPPLFSALFRKEFSKSSKGTHGFPSSVGFGIALFCLLVFPAFIVSASNNQDFKGIWMDTDQKLVELPALSPFSGQNGIFPTFYFFRNRVFEFMMATPVRALASCDFSLLVYSNERGNDLSYRALGTP